MSLQAPRYSDLSLEFDSLAYNVAPTVIDLTAVDLILTIALSGAPDTPILRIQKSVTGSAFTIDNTAKSVIVAVAASSLGSALGQYLANLWIMSGGRYMTHLPKTFEVVESVNHELSS